VRKIALKGVADRLDLLADGTFRLIDYKLSSAPQKSRALQLPIYGLCAEQRLQSHKGRAWTLGEAAYIAFRGGQRVVPLFTARGGRRDGEDAGSRRTVRPSSSRRRRPGQHPRDHVYAQGGGGDAAADRRAAARSQPAVAARRGAVARLARPDRRHRDLDDRCV